MYFGVCVCLLIQGQDIVATGRVHCVWRRKQELSNPNFILRPKVYPKKQIDIRLSDLKCIGYLGVGGFGSVTLQLDRRTQETYALKSISKGYIMKRKMQKGRQ